MAMAYPSAEQIRSLIQANPKVEFHSIDLLTSPDREGLNWAGLDSESDRPGVMAYQRLLGLRVDLDMAERMIKHGFLSANHIARVPRKRFIREFVSKLRLDPSQAEAVHQRATGIRNKTMQLWASVRATAGSVLFSRLPLDTVSEDLKSKFQNLPSYQDLFGSLDYVECEECRSIFGATAYLCDLLRIIDECVTTPNSQTIDAAFLFSARRPDIGDIELTCASTNDLIPYLQIVNERLTDRARQWMKLPNSGDITKKIATTLVYPSQLPFNAPLDRITMLLDKVGAGFGSILAAWKIQDSTVAARSLGLSVEQQSIIITEQKDASGVAPFYNMAPNDLGTLASADTFLAKTWTVFPDLLTLLQQDLSGAEQAVGLQANFFINQGLSGKWVAVEKNKDGEYILSNLDVGPLDKINRLLRLSARVGQPAQDVDWALCCVQSGATPVITNDALVSLYRLKNLSSALSLSFAASTVLLGPIKTYGQGLDGSGTVFDRLFNSPAILMQQKPYRPAGNPLNPGYTDPALAWTPGSANAADVAAINRVLPGLGLALTDANALGLFLYGAHATDLTVEVLSVLYRHSQLSRALRQTIARYVVFLALMGLKGTKTPSVVELERMVEAGQWLIRTGLSVYQLDYLINGNPSVFVNPMYRPDLLAQWQQGLWQLILPTSRSTGNDITAQVAIVFGASVTRIATLMQMATTATALPAGAQSWEAAFLAAESDGKTPKYPAYIGAVFLYVSRWLMMAEALKLADETLASVLAHPAAYLVPDNFAALPWEAIRSIQLVQQMMEQVGDQQQNLLAYIDAASADKPLDDQLAALQRATGWLPGQVKELLSGPVNETVIVERLASLQTCFNLLAGLEADVALMSRIAALGDTPATNWSDYLNLANDVLTKTAARYGPQWDGIWLPLFGALNVHERDALLALVLYQLNTDDPTIKTARNVYEFLLTDVDMGSVTQISRLKEALNAAQLYLQRCRLRLEPGVNDLSLIQDAWWDWMMNYRVWEANRQIFVYPENYLVPSLRKSVTQQFAGLAQALQQSDITKPYVAAAFRGYIDGFAEVAQLKPVDAYRTRTADAETTYLLARTKTGPYTFYYCSQTDGMPWTPWEKIDLTINSANCTLVYAFSRPFLFWNEIKRISESAVSGNGGIISTSNGATSRASLMYSFINQEGKWAQAQTLIDQAVVYFDADDNRKIRLKDLTIFEDLFVTDDSAWTKVFAFGVEAQNYQSKPANPSEAERLVVMYGPNLLNTGTSVDTQTQSPTTDPSASAFWSNLHNRADDHNRVVLGQLSGELLLRPVSVLNLSLEPDALIRRQEYLLADPYQAASPLSLICVGLQNSGAVIQTSHTCQPVTNNRLGGCSAGLTAGSFAMPVNGYSFITAGITPSQSTQIFQALLTAQIVDRNGNISPTAMKTLDLYAVLSSIAQYNVFGPPEYSSVLTVLFEHMGATPLFNSVGGNQPSITPVRGQLGWFVIFLSDEVFLLSPKPVTEGKPLFSTFAGGIVLGDPLLTSMSCVMSYQGSTPGEIGAAASGQVITELTKKFSLISNGRLTAQATLDNVKFALSNLVLLKVITDAQIPYIYHALVNAPILYAAAFIGDKIDSTISTKIYNALQIFSIIDPNGRIDEPTLTGTNVRLALSNLLLAGTLSSGQIAGIYNVLAHAPKAVAVRYVNQGDASNLTNTSDFIFYVTRLSTGAIQKVSRTLLTGGVDTLLDTKNQDIPVIPVQPFDRFGPSTTNLLWPSTLDATQVDFDGLYGQYYWEIFYHIPMLVAYALNTNQQFQTAQSWLHYVFNPTIAERFVNVDVLVSETVQAISSQQATGIIQRLETHKIGDPANPILKNGEVNPQFQATTDLSFLKAADPSLTDLQISMVRNILLNYQLVAPSSHFWRFRPFRNHTLETLQAILSDDNPAIKIYNDDPFDPFAIARLRIGAFEKATLMQYVDNLIAWGDQLFTSDTWESITAAYMLYAYTYDLLGPKPQAVGEAAGVNLSLTFNQIKAKYPDGIPQFLIDLEHFVSGTGLGADVATSDHAFNELYAYFCVPENSNLMSRWDTIQDRMYKINNSMNIAGVVRTLPLFQPPLNPLDLVRAAAAGNNVQGSSTAPPELSPYRYTSAFATAQSLCATVIELGNALLSASEKNDASGLERLRINQEAQILAMTTQTRLARIDELQATIHSLTSSQEGAQYRVGFYKGLIASDLNANEIANLSATEAALAFNLLGSVSKTAATIGYAVPQVGSPFAMTYGGVQLGNALNAASGVFEIGAAISSFVAERTATMAGYARREQDWTLQAQQAQYDVDTLTQQIAAANYQLQAAQQDLAIHLKSISQNKAIDDYLRKKFTSQELYQWMLGRLAGVYFQTYSLALRAARQAEAGFQFEMDSDRSFVTFQYWNSLHNGLTAGEGLRLALNRMDEAYRANDTRALEVERSISLALAAPDQLLALKNTGRCTFSFGEALFDYDYPGQYLRKIKTISLSIPAVVGPYQNIKAILTQTKNSVVTEPKIEVVNYLLGLTSTKPSQGLREDWASGQSIAISRGVDDSGMFVLDFQDQRYLPFENTGLVSTWQLEMPIETNRFDFQQLSDVIITVRYLARHDGTLAGQVKSVLGQVPLSGGIYLNASMQSAAWQAFLANHSDANTQTLTLEVDPSQIGFFKTLTYVEAIVRLDVAAGVQLPATAAFLTFASGAQSATPKLDHGQGTVSNLKWDGKTLPPSWNFSFSLKDSQVVALLTNGFIDGTKLLSMEIIVLYQATVF